MFRGVDMISRPASGKRQRLAIADDDLALFAHCFGSLARRALSCCRVITTRAGERRTTTWRTCIGTLTVMAAGNFNISNLN